MTNPDDDGREMLVEQALAEYMQKCDSGVQLDRAQFLAQHEDLREQLSELLDVADWVESLAGPRVVDIAQSATELTDDQGKGQTQVLLAADDEDTLVPEPDSAHSLDKSTEPRFFSGQGFIDDTTEHPNELPSASLSQPVLPCRFGDYVLERVLGRGGMGVVYYGRQMKLDRPVAVKMIRSGALASNEEVSRFYAEARSAAKLDHPNIVTVYQCGEHNGHHFFSMDFVPGKDLSKMSNGHPLDCKQAARYVRDTARAIQYAHEQGIVHRDLKPANVLVDDKDKVRITDFGLAKSIDCDSGLTATGAALGTPSYMAPEQAAGQVNQHHWATDIYSLGAVLFATVTGKPPFKGPTVVQTIMQVIHRQAPKASSINPRVDSDLDTIIDVCLQKAPEQRYKTAGALADDLDRYLVGAPIEARPMPATRRAWYWLLGVPIFGAVLDNRVVEPTEAHRWVQRGVISVLLLMLCSLVLLFIPATVWHSERMPKKVRIAAGVEGENYHRIASVIEGLLEGNYECDAEVIASVGSVDNGERLRRGEVDLAIMQADAIDRQLSIVTPLYYEAVHILVRRGLDISRLDELRGRSVRVGSRKAGSHHVAMLMLGYAGLTLSDVVVDESPFDFSDSAGGLPDAIIVVARLGSQQVLKILKSEQYRLFSFPDAWQFALVEPIFRPNIISETHYPGCSLSNDGVTAVAIAAFLVARPETPAELIQGTLTQLFTSDVVQSTGIISANDIAHHWSDAAWHPAAQAFFSSHRGSAPAVLMRQD